MKEVQLLGPRGAKNFDVPSGASRRLSWRPARLIAVRSFLTSLSSRTHPFLTPAEQLSAWHQQFARRVTPWGGWSALPLEFPGERFNHGGSIGDEQATHAITPTRDSGKNTAVERPGGPLSRSRPPLIPSRPPVQIAILRPHPRGDATLTPGKMRGRLSTFPPAAGDLNRPGVENDWANLMPHQRRDTQSDVFPPESRGEEGRETGPLTNASSFRSRILLAASSSPRRERRGGYPIRTLMPAMPFQRDTTQTAPEASPSTVDLPEAPGSQVLAPSRPEGESSALQRLIEATVLPVPLPGMELRLASRDWRMEKGLDRKSNDPSEPHNGPSAPPPVTPPARPETPALDLNAVADKVYQTLMRRRQRERERRGLY